MDIGILLLIVFVLAPLLEKLLQAGRPKPPPQQGRMPPQRRPAPGQRPRAPEQEEQPFRSIPSADADADEQSAAAMLPDDLWEILTGEKRPSRAETSAEPAPEVRRADVPHEERPRTLDRRPAAQAGERTRRPVPSQRRPPAPPRERRLPEVTMRRDPAETRMRPAARRHESPPDDYIREIPVHEAPVVVPFEAPSLDPEERRAAFKARRGKLSEAATVAHTRRVFEFGQQSTEELRRAIIMAEVLGKPRGLQE